MNQTFDPHTFVHSYAVIGTNNLQCDNIIHMLYAAILSKYKTVYSEKECMLFLEFQDRIFNLVEEMRTLKKSDLVSVLEYCAVKNTYLPDIIIMFWCEPRKGKYLSKKMYDLAYAQLIQSYNHQLIDIIDHPLMSQFCIETLSKKNNVPIHCIDYLWFHMDQLPLQFVFYPYHSGCYLHLCPINETENVEVSIGLNMAYLMDVHLGRVFVKGKCLRDIIKKLVTDPIYVDASMESKIYKTQYLHILKHADSYFSPV